MLLTLFLLSTLPGLLIVAYIYWRDRYEQEPFAQLSLCFLFGMLSAYPALKMEEFGIRDLGILNNANDPFMTFTFSFMVVAFSEEFVKYLFLRYYIFRQPVFDEPLDGIVYAIMIGMGFATLENVLYIIVRPDNAQLAVQIGLMRMLTAIPAHAIFAVTMGYFVGWAKFVGQQRNRYLFIGLSSAIVLHGIYDFCVFMHLSLLLVGFVIVTGIGLSLLFLHRHSRYAALLQEEE